jgi:putative protein-disulfide isomerase
MTEPAKAQGQPARHFLYVADPLCSWCYGFAPVIGALAAHFEGRLGLRIVMGGLRAGNTKPMRPEDKAYIKDAWTRVAAASGQTFDHAFFDRDGFIYDTEPACRAVVTAREWGAPTPVTPLAFKARISEAFYAHNRDVTDPAVIGAIAEEAGFDGADFAARFASAEMKNATFRDFLTAQEMGVRGFPLLAAGSVETNYALVTNGFRPLDGLIEALEAWLANGAPVTKYGATPAA